MEKILVVDDEKDIADLIEVYLQNENYTVFKFYTAEDALRCIETQSLDLAILDIMLPGTDGFALCKKIREKYIYPVIMLTAKDAEVDKINGLTLGADDYVTKPFKPLELMARVKVVLKRSARQESDAQLDKYVFEGLEVDISGREVYVNGEKASMTPKEYDLLFYLVKNKNIALTRDKLLEEVWGYDFFGDDRTVDTHIKMLRNSLGEYRKFIVTLRGMGYKFEA